MAGPTQSMLPIQWVFPKKAIFHAFSWFLSLPTAYQYQKATAVTAQEYWKDGMVKNSHGRKVFNGESPLPRCFSSPVSLGLDVHCLSSTLHFNKLFHSHPQAAFQTLELTSRNFPHVAQLSTLLHAMGAASTFQLSSQQHLPAAPLGRAAHTNTSTKCNCGLTQKLPQDLLNPCPELGLLLASKSGL